jgi:hypothetical protein
MDESHRSDNLRLKAYTSELYVPEAVQTRRFCNN